MGSSRAEGELRPRAIDLTRSSRGWIVKFKYRRRTETMSSRIIIDCSGRTSRLLKPFGAERIILDRLICGCIYGSLASGVVGISYTEADADGWWYTAALPGKRRILAWHTDADLPARSYFRSRYALLERACRSLELSDQLSDSSFDGNESPRVMAAYSSALVAAAGDDWLAAGDAASCFDPLSSQGLFHALYTGLASAEAADRALSGDRFALSTYAARCAEIFAAYQRNLKAAYGIESRWPDREFWRRRSGIGTHRLP